MDAFERELMQRSPLAGCVLETCDYVWDAQLLEQIWQDHRGRCYEDVLRFDVFLRLMREALIRHGGSAHQVFLELESRGDQPVDESNFYRKLARTPVALSRALLRECTQRLHPLMPSTMGSDLPDCFDPFMVVIGDGKTIKNATKRLKPSRGYAGQLLGAKALVALDARSGLVLAMSESLDGMANDVPLVPQLMPQLHGISVARPLLSVWDRQFDDRGTLGRLASREGDCFVVRMKQLHSRFTVESTAQSLDGSGRRVLDEIGMLGRGRQALRVRRITLSREGADQQDVVLLSNLLDRAVYAADDLLTLYRRRWGIEQVFQQVTETFSLTHLIGSSPKAILLQFAFCLLLYNVMQLVRAYMAVDGDVALSMVSMFYLFTDTRKELQAWAYHTDGTWPRTSRDAAAMRRRLHELMQGSWHPIKYTKASDKKPRPKRPPPRRLHGGHSSIQRAIEGTAKVLPA